MSDSQNNTEMQELEPVRILTLEDESGAKLPVEVVVEIEQDGEVYVLLTPAEPLVMVLREDKNDEDAALEALDSDEFQAVKKHIHDALIQHNVSINVKGEEFVLVGEPEESFYAECDVMEIEEADGAAEYLVLVEVDDGSARYLVVMPIEPALYPGLLTSDSEARLLSDAELEKVESLFSEVLSEWAEADEEDEEA